MGEIRPRHNRELLFLPRNKPQIFLNTKPNRISKHQVLIQLLSCHVWKDMGKSKSVEGNEPLHTAGGPTGY